jgi:site-specific recombinase XerD
VAGFVLWAFSNRLAKNFPANFMACSARVRVRSTYTRADGTNQVYLQLIIQRVVKWLPLDLHWPAKHFDEAAGKALPRRRGDKEADDLNLQAGQELARVNRIFVDWRLREQELTMPEFLKAFSSKLNRGNFCDYFETKLSERWSSGEITDLSYKTQRATLRKVQEFNPTLPFSNLKPGQFAKKFDLWLEKVKGSSANTRWARHKDVKTYLHLAEKDNIRFDCPYEDFKVSKVAGKWLAAQPREIELLNTYYDTLPLGTTRRRYLRRWLFGVATGLRLSDQRRAKRDWLLDTTLVFLMHKGRRKGKLVKLPLGRRALALIQDALREGDGQQGNIFIDASGQKSNDAMEAIRQELGIKSRLHNHVGRESFATLYLENGGSLEVLKEYLAHSFIETTMKYVHVSDARKRRDLGMVDAIFERTTDEARVRQ